MIEIIGAPFDLCGQRLGSRLGPDALRLAGLEETLRAMGLDVMDAGNVEVPRTCDLGSGLRGFDAVFATIRRLRAETGRCLAEGHLPLVLGGEHTLAVAGISSALQTHGEEVGLLWIDAHADVNTPGSSQTGNIHGMPVAALAGLPSGREGVADLQWRRLREELLPGPALRLENVAWYGLRDVDEGEKPNLQGLPITMHDIDRRGVEATVGKVAEWFRARDVGHLWISFDVDVLDPFLAPGTGTAVRGGLSYREAHLLAELLHETLTGPGGHCRLAGIDVVETNPIVDTMNSTAIVAVEWVASLLGKTIL
ncbi:MAG TPA: arginase [Fimbriimonas sp.]